MRWSDLHGDMESQAEMAWPPVPTSGTGSNNMNGPKVAFAAPAGRKARGAFGYVLERLRIWWYSRRLPQ